MNLLTKAQNETEFVVLTIFNKKSCVLVWNWLLQKLKSFSFCSSIRTNFNWVLQCQNLLWHTQVKVFTSKRSYFEKFFCSRTLSSRVVVQTGCLYKTQERSCKDNFKCLSCLPLRFKPLYSLFALTHRQHTDVRKNSRSRSKYTRVQDWFGHTNRLT